MPDEAFIRPFGRANSFAALRPYCGVADRHSRKTSRTLRQRNSKEILGDDQ